MHIEPSRRRRRRLVSLTPLIDVVFILLVFFMLASSFAEWRTIKLDAPAKASTQSSAQGAILVRVHAEGGIDVNGQAISLAGLAGHLAQKVHRHPKREVLIEPVDNPPLQRVVSVLDRADRAGARRVAFARDQD